VNEKSGLMFLMLNKKVSSNSDLTPETESSMRHLHSESRTRIYYIYLELIPPLMHASGDFCPWSGFRTWAFGVLIISFYVRLPIENVK
jgi:hypothetical protein